jgi:hypothetical protein
MAESVPLDPTMAKRHAERLAHIRHGTGYLDHPFRGAFNNNFKVVLSGKCSHSRHVPGIGPILLSVPFSRKDLVPRRAFRGRRSGLQHDEDGDPLV